MRAEHGRVDGQERTALMRLKQALDLGARMRHLPKRLFARLGIGLGRAMKKRGTDARSQQAVDGRVVVRRRRVVMTPIDQRGGAAVDLVDRPHQGGNVQVFGRKHRGQTGVHLGKVLEQGPVGSQPAQRRLPGVHVGIDQPRNDDAAGGIDHLGALGVDHGGDLDDLLAAHQQIAAGQIPLAVHGDDGGTADQRGAIGHGFKTPGRRSSSRSRS